ncbi:MAG: plasmid mobilization relaxosome protein MobC [Oscillospiraceae bacterium]|nr:plasmid mobilization relaxosome protein MobC [Oscillospiraceae bacterium]
MRKRDVHVQLWLNQKEAETLSLNADRCRLTQSAYLRHLIMGYVPREAPPLDYRAMMQQIYHVGRSLNQIAAKAHVLNVIDAQRYDESIHMLEKTILKIEDAVIVPQKMGKEELLEDYTAQEY